MFTIDRLGLQHELRLNHSSAKIGASGDRVVDVFYVSERDESKPTGEERLGKIRGRLEEIINSPAG